MTSLVQLYHYYDKEMGPFKNLSSLPIQEANKISITLKQAGKGFASQRSDDYMETRKQLEEKARRIFLNKGGKPKNHYPNYMTLGPCEWIKTWYENGQEITIDLDEFEEESISFTYGDLFPTMRYKDGKEYRGQVYTKNEIFEIIGKYGLPQEWNSKGEKGPERYIEVQIWDEDIIKAYCK